MATRSRTDLDARLARVRLFLCDVDGVLTDGSVVIGKGAEYKCFNILDGYGLRLLQESGIPVGWISRRRSQPTRQRARELKIDYLAQISGDKVAAAKTILARAGARWDEVCFVGDDLLDLGMLKRVGLPVAVADAIPEARALAVYVTKTPGGRGAVREVATLILKAQGHWARLVREHSA